jgi:hypothetical protein
MFGLGGQEILLLLVCGAVPAVAVGIVLLATRRTNRTPDSGPEDDEFR